MLNRLPSARNRRRMNRRQRKKLRVGEFQELVFEVRIQFRLPMDGAAHDAFMDGFIEHIESHQLAVGGMGGQLPLLETEGIVSACGRGSATVQDRFAVLDWLRQHPKVASAKTGELVDGWYGRKEIQSPMVRDAIARMQNAPAFFRKKEREQLAAYDGPVVSGDPLGHVPENLEDDE